MVEIYISWCKGLPENEEALGIIKDSGIIDGIETSDYRDIEKIRSAGLKTSIHRPFRDKSFNLEDGHLPSFTKEDIKECNKSDPPFLSFHLINSEKRPKNDEGSLSGNIKKNIERLESLFEKRVVFEFSPYQKNFVEIRGRESVDFFTGKEILNDLFENTSAGFSFGYLSCLCFGNE